MPCCTHRTKFLGTKADPGILACNSHSGTGMLVRMHRTSILTTGCHGNTFIEFYP